MRIVRVLFATAGSVILFVTLDLDPWVNAGIVCFTFAVMPDD